jgi:hypothetical protein
LVANAATDVTLLASPQGFLNSLAIGLRDRYGEGLSYAKGSGQTSEGLHRSGCEKYLPLRIQTLDTRSRVTQELRELTVHTGLP